MNRWEGKVAIVTGASADIGLTVAKTLFKEGMTVVGVARRKELMESEMRNIKGKGKFYALKCDVSKEEDVSQVFEWIRKNLGSVHVIINNAGFTVDGKIEDTNKEHWQHVTDVNFLGKLYFCKQAIKLLQQSGEEGHLINMSSIFGSGASLDEGEHINVLPAAHNALNALTTTLELELLGSKIRMTTISPGNVQTKSIRDEGLDLLYQARWNNPPFIEEQDIADAIVYILSTHPRVQITQMTIKPLGERI